MITRGIAITIANHQGILVGESSSSLSVLSILSYEKQNDCISFKFDPVIVSFNFIDSKYSATLSHEHSLFSLH